MARKILGAPLWLWGLLGGAAFLAVTQRKTIMIYGTQAIEAGKEYLFGAALPARAQPYADLILQVAREQDVDPFIIYALGDRESLWGQALTPPDPSGTGDFTPRDAAAWKYAMPPDGGGWGRGLMQIDYPTVVARGINWPDPYTNISGGTTLYKEKVRELLAAPSGNWNIGPATAAKLGVQPGTYPAQSIPENLVASAAMAAYNAGSANVRMAYSAGGADAIDRVTTGRDYSADAWERMLAAVAEYGKVTGTG
jgi:hypothetical protein